MKCAKCKHELPRSVLGFILTSVTCQECTDKERIKRTIVHAQEYDREIALGEIAEKKYNKSAIIGLVLSIIAVFGVGLAGITGFVLGIVALVQVRYTHEKGKGLAIAAIIVGFIWSFVIGILRRLVEAGF